MDRRFEWVGDLAVRARRHEAVPAAADERNPDRLRDQYEQRRFGGRELLDDAGKGNIQVWPGGRVPSKTYQPSKYYYLWPPAYNATGDLFAEGQVLNGAYGLTELPKGASALRSVKLGGVTIHYAGGVFWDGHALGVTDQNAGNDNTTTIYRMTFKGANGRLVGRTHLTDTCNKDYADVVTPFPVRTNGTTTEVIGGNLWCAHRFDYWKYPAGGTPTSQLPKAPEEPFGESVSPARKAGSD